MRSVEGNRWVVLLALGWVVAACGPSESDDDGRGLGGSSGDEIDDGLSGSGNDSAGDSSESSGATSATTGAGDSSGTTSASTTGETTGPDTTTAAESTGPIPLDCPAYVLEETCEAGQSLHGNPCSWLELVPTVADSCEQGEPVGFCVEAVGEPGCATTPGCADGEAFIVTLDDGAQAPFVTCGGPYPPLESQRCDSADEGLCACAC